MSDINIVLARFSALHDMLEELYFTSHHARRTRLWKTMSRMLSILQDEVEEMIDTPPTKG